MEVEHAKEVVTGFIESAVQTSIYRVDWVLAGLLRDSWAAWWARADFDTCLYTAQVIIAELPRKAPTLTPSGFDPLEIPLWKRRAGIRINQKKARIWCQFPGYGHWWWYRRNSSDYGMYCKALRLVDAGVELANAWTNKLGLHLIMYERPELLPRLLRYVECEVA